MSFDFFNINEKSSTKKSMLELYGTDLTQLASNGQLEKTFNREDELKKLMEILIRREKNNAILIGNPGVGKRAIVENFAEQIIKGSVPLIFLNRKIVFLDFEHLVAGTTSRAHLDQRIYQLINEILNDPNIIILFDEIHNIYLNFNAGFDFLNSAKALIAKSIGFQCIATITPVEYELYIVKDSILFNKFQPIYIKQFTGEQVKKILYKICPIYESFHNIKISYSLIDLAIDLSIKYIPNKQLPDKVIDIFDCLGAKKVLEMTKRKENSEFSCLLKISLINLEKIRYEAYIRNDIVTQFIITEVINSYRNFLLCWLDNPLNIVEKDSKTLSPISTNLFNKMQITILKLVENYFFSSNKQKIIIKKIKKIKNLTSNKNYRVYNEFLNEIEKKNFYSYSIYRIALFLFKKFLNNFDEFNNKDLIFIKLNKIILNQIKISNSIQYIESIFYLIKKIKLKTCSEFSCENDFYEKDFENDLLNINKLSELETNKSITFENFLKTFNPILEKTAFAGLNKAYKLKFSKEETLMIYNLLGYLTNKYENLSLYALDDLDLIKRFNILNGEELSSKIQTIIVEEDIIQIISEISGLTIKKNIVDKNKYNNLESYLKKNIIGQEEAILNISKAVKRVQVGIKVSSKPIGSFLFCGPTGVGKTEITKVLATFMFGSANKMLRFDMSEFMEKHTISRLIGSPPGYVGYEEPSEFFSYMQKNPDCIILFDEVEKAHAQILNLLLQVLDDGRLTDNRKELMSFTNSIIIMTSNAAALEIQEFFFNLNSDTFGNNKILFNEEKNIDKKFHNNKKLNFEKILQKIRTDKNYKKFFLYLNSFIKINFTEELEKVLINSLKNSLKNFSNPSVLNLMLTTTKKINKNQNFDNSDSKEIKEFIMGELNHFFLPEFLNRFDDIIIFRPLTIEDLKKICFLLIEKLKNVLKNKNIFIELDSNVINKICIDSYNPRFGARPLKRYITQNIEDYITNYLTQDNSKNMNNYFYFTIDKITNKIIIDKKK